MHSAILERVRAGYHSSVSEYIRSLVRRDRFAPDQGSGEKRTYPRLRRANECITEITKPDVEL
jgi:Arc/MetJ-type ribon-helix-helix transcriptional regulator